MKPNLFYFILTGSVLLLTVQGCKRAPAPVVNPPAVETSLAGTARALAKQTETANPYTATPPLTPTETLTPTPAISTMGTSMARLADGSTQFTDYRAGIQIVFPPNWLALRVGEREYYSAWEKEGARNADLLDAITAIQNLDPNIYRMTAYDMAPEEIMYGSLPKINIVFLQDDKRSLYQIESNERTQKSALSKYQYLSSAYQDLPWGEKALIAQYKWESADPTHGKYTSRYKGFLFKVPNGTVAVDLFIPIDQKDVIDPQLDQIINSITLLTPAP